MAWWELETSKYPDIPVPDDSGLARAGLGGTLIFLGALAFLASVVLGFIFRAWSAGVWGIGASLAVALIGGALLPKARKPRA